MKSKVENKRRFRYDELNHGQLMPYAKVVIEDCRIIAEMPKAGMKSFALSFVDLELPELSAEEFHAVFSDEVFEEIYHTIKKSVNEIKANQSPH